MLGVPLGPSSTASPFVKGKLFSRLEKTVGRLQDFQDSQSALYLLRVSFSIVRATHFMRTTPLDLWSGEATAFDRVIRTSVESILGYLSEVKYTQACLTPTLGGLGLRRVVDHAGAAFSASFRESGLTAAEQWVVPPSVLGSLGSQKEASFRIDQAWWSAPRAEVSFV